MNELLEMLETCDDDEISDDGLDIVMLPPENAMNDVTDEDSGTEEDLNVNNQPGSQLNAEIVIFNETLLAPPFPSEIPSQIPDISQAVSLPETSDTAQAVSPAVNFHNLNSAVPSQIPLPQPTY